jgi:hypothetical protein
MAFTVAFGYVKTLEMEGQAKKTVGGTRRETEAPPVTVEESWRCLAG